MATKVVASAATRTIEVIEAPVAGVQDLHLVDDIYSRLKEDWLADATLQAVKFPFRTFGDPTRPGTQIGPYIFFNNIAGWRFVPYDVDHTLRIAGASLIGESAVAGGSLPVWSPRSGRTIIVRDELSAQALTVSAGSGVTEQDKDDIRDRILSDSTPFVGANVDAAISSRATAAQILSDATPFPGARVTEARPRRGQALVTLPFVMVDTNNRLPKTGLTVSGKVRKDGGAFTALTNPVVELEDGMYDASPTASEMDADVLAFIFSAPGAVTIGFTVVTSQ